MTHGVVLAGAVLPSAPRPFAKKTMSLNIRPVHDERTLVLVTEVARRARTVLEEDVAVRPVRSLDDDTNEGAVVLEGAAVGGLQRDADLAGGAQLSIVHVTNVLVVNPICWSERERESQQRWWKM